MRKDILAFKSRRGTLNENEKELFNRNRGKYQSPLKDASAGISEQALARRKEAEYDPIRSLSQVGERYQHFVSRLEHYDQEQLANAWEQADSVMKIGAWMKGHVALNLNRRYGAGAIIEFSQAKNLHKSTVYEYMKLAAIFPTPDPLLEPTFHMIAIRNSGGEEAKARKLIERAHKEKAQNKSYSIRDFRAALEEEKAQKGADPNPTPRLVAQLRVLVEKLIHAQDYHSYRADINAIVAMLEKN
jgi:hypothetical protein